MAVHAIIKYTVEQYFHFITGYQAAINISSLSLAYVSLIAELGNTATKCMLPKLTCNQVYQMLGPECIYNMSACTFSKRLNLGGNNLRCQNRTVLIYVKLLPTLKAVLVPVPPCMIY